jgi:hypothetical protein
MLLSLESYSQLSPVVLQNFRPVQSDLGVLSAADPWRRFKIEFLNSFSEQCLEPEHYSIGLARA